MHRLLRYLPAALVLFVGLSNAAHAQIDTRKLAAPEFAPAWQLQTPAGKTVNFPEDANGKPTVLLFWPSWCPFSRALQPYVQDIWEDYGTRINVWTINILENGDPVQTLKDRGLSFPLLLKGDALRNSYKIQRTPWLVVINAKNRIVYTRPPQPPTPIHVAKKVRTTLNQLLGEQAVALPTSYPERCRGSERPRQCWSTAEPSASRPHRDALRSAQRWQKQRPLKNPHSPCKASADG
jgi:thiol-disulfide isomerase/thioredoxin